MWLFQPDPLWPHGKPLLSVGTSFWRTHSHSCWSYTFTDKLLHCPLNDIYKPDNQIPLPQCPPCLLWPTVAEAFLVLSLPQAHLLPHPALPLLLSPLQFCTALISLCSADMWTLLCPSVAPRYTVTLNRLCGRMNRFMVQIVKLLIISNHTQFKFKVNVMLQDAPNLK
jgi:hypothetical protein